MHLQLCWAHVQEVSVGQAKCFCTSVGSVMLMRWSGNVYRLSVSGGGSHVSEPFRVGARSQVSSIFDNVSQYPCGKIGEIWASCKYG